MRSLVIVAFAVLAALASAPASAQSISYQGRFADNGAIPVGNYEIRFRLFNQAEGGQTVGATLIRLVELSADDAGVFSFQDLDFGTGVFNGQPRWIEVAVRRLGEAFEVLSPRQPVNPTPYSIFAQTSGTTLQQAYNNAPTVNVTPGIPLRVVGQLQTGSPTTNGVFQLFQQNAGTPVIQMANNSAQGGSLRIRDENGADIVFLEADFHGTGGYLRILGDGGELLFDGDQGPGANTGSLFSITGPGSSLVFDTAKTGNEALILPPNSVGPSEIFAGPGLAGNFRLGNVAVASTNQNNPTTIISRSITVPAPGHVIVMATCNIDVTRSASVLGTLIMGVSDAPNSMPGRYRTLIQLPGTAFVSGRYFFSGASHGVFEVTQPGQYTYYFNASSTGFGSPGISNPNLTLIYIPTTYGEVAQPAGLLGPQGGGDMPYLMPLSQEDIFAEQLAEQYRAMEQLRAEQAQLQAQLKKLQDRLDRAR
ncbi:MAG: hypothetical protein LAT64_12730 [Phycisphaerales bacterium]|nr:hypothetical protein [Planctomycetota bacterium]MCH8509619.1 hypothetical protein [Phycisphaerales bacterium]